MGEPSASGNSALQIEHVPIDQLRPDPANPRRISDAELEALTRSLQEFGFVQPVLARREDNTVIGGHQRLVAARRLGYTIVPVVYVDLSLQQARLLNLALNKISGEFDQELLARLLADLDTGAADLTLTGFADDEVKKLLRSLEHREKGERDETFDLDAALGAAQAAHGANVATSGRWANTGCYAVTRSILRPSPARSTGGARRCASRTRPTT